MLYSDSGYVSLQHPATLSHPFKAAPPPPVAPPPVDCDCADQSPGDGTGNPFSGGVGGVSPWFPYETGYFTAWLLIDVRPLRAA